MTNQRWRNYTSNKRHPISTPNHSSWLFRLHWRNWIKHSFQLFWKWSILAFKCYAEHDCIIDFMWSWSCFSLSLWSLDCQKKLICDPQDLKCSLPTRMRRSKTRLIVLQSSVLMKSNQSFTWSLFPTVKTGNNERRLLC